MSFLPVWRVMLITDGVVCSPPAQTPRFVDQVNRCKVVHTPVGIEAFVSESIVRERYGKIYRTYNRIRSALAGDCNEYLPFYRLHDDLMVEIWSYLSILDRHHIAAVSRRFRSIALNTAHLWTFINFGNFPSVPQIDTLLKRAGASPLHIRVNDQGMPPLRPPSSYPYLPPPAASVPLKPLSPPSDVVAAIPRAAVLDAIIFRKEAFPPSPTTQYPIESRLKLEALNMPMPLLRSLRLSTILTYPFNIQHASTQVTEPLFSGHTPSLRHVAVIQCNLNWLDPAFRNLTYLLIRRPDHPFDVSLLVPVLRASPSLTYLGLEAAIAPVEPDKIASSVDLPALQRLYITDKDTQRITSTLRRINAPNVLECDFTSADSSWFDSHQTMGFSPFNHLHATQEVTLTITENYAYHWIIECRRSAKHATRFHFDPTVMNYYATAATGRDYENETAKLIDTLRGSSILFGQVRLLTLRGCFSITRLGHIFSMFPAIERLSTRHLSPPRNHGVGNGTTIFDILPNTYCPRLQAIDIGAWPEHSPSGLLRWVSARAGGEGGCSKLNEVVVTSEKPLPSEARSSIVSMLDRFLWRKFMVPKPSYYGPYMYHPSGWYSPPVIPTSVPSPITRVTTTQPVEDGSWDEDEEWARVPCPPDPVPPILPLNSNLSVLDDPTLVHCDRALQRRWDYFAIPGM